MAKARTALDEGFALNTHGSLVNGLTPLRAGVAGFFLSFKFNMPAILNWPFFLSSPAANSMYAVMIALASLPLRPVFSATAAIAAAPVMAPPAFIAFIAFIAGAMLCEGSGNQ